jgi:O-antigen/teichoic acid export membrane protein/SAM-dependent methyltransferase
MSDGAGRDRTWLRAWLGRGVWAVADQACFAGANFGANVCLARWLEPREYGAFAVGFAGFLLLSIFHTTLVVEPMLVFGGSRHRLDFAAYLRVLVRLTALLGAGCGVLAVAIAFLGPRFGAGEVTAVVATLGLGLPGILVFWLARRACYVVGAPGLAVSGAAAYGAALFVGLVGLRACDALSAVAGAAVMAVGSVAAAGWLLGRLRVASHEAAGPAALAPGDRLAWGPRDVVREHWAFGRWGASSALVRWLGVNVYVLLLPFSAGLEAAGAFSALVSLTMPFVNVETAVAALLIPALARVRGDGRFDAAVRSALAVLVAGALLFWLALGLLHGPLVHWVFAGRYDGYGHALWMLGLVPVAFAVTTVVGAALRAREEPRELFVAHATAMAIALAVGLGLLVGWRFEERPPGTPSTTWPRPPCCSRAAAARRGGMDRPAPSSADAAPCIACGGRTRTAFPRDGFPPHSCGPPGSGLRRIRTGMVEGVARVEAVLKEPDQVRRYRDDDPLTHGIERGAWLFARLAERAVVGDGRLLDLGCGYGGLSIAWARGGRRAVAVDANPQNVATLACRLRAGVAAPGDVTPLVGSALALPLAGGSVDMALMIGVVEWLGYSDRTAPVWDVQRRGLRETGRVLRPGGRLVIGTKNRLFPRYFWRDGQSGKPLVNALPEGAARGLASRAWRLAVRGRVYSLWGWRRLVASAGLAIERVFVPVYNYQFPLLLADPWERTPIRSRLRRAAGSLSPSLRAAAVGVGHPRRPAYYGALGRAGLLGLGGGSLVLVCRTP